jgi:hypothetical protein
MASRPVVADVPLLSIPVTKTPSVMVAAKL